MKCLTFPVTDMNTCYIVGAAECTRLPTPDKTDLVIAADGGYDTLKKSGIRCDLLIGDLDSIESEDTSIETVRHPKMKDETDMHLAYLEGAGRGYTDFVIYGGLGGRFDHTFANYSLLLYIRNRGHRASLICDTGATYLIKNEEITITGNAGKYFSVFPFGSDTTGVSIKGAKYNVEGAKMNCEFPIGVSNEFVGGGATVGVKDGALLIICEI